MYQVQFKNQILKLKKNIILKRNMSSCITKQECPTGTLIDLNPSQDFFKSMKDPFWYLKYYCQDSDGDTQLHILMSHLPQHFPITKIMISSTWPASLLDIRNHDGMTAQHLAAIQNASDIVRLLLVSGANPMSKDNYGRIPLHYACRDGYTSTIIALTQPFDNVEVEEMRSKKLLIRHLPETIDMRDAYGNMALHIATEKGRLHVVELLLKLGARVDAITFQNGYRPIHIAIMQGHKHVVKFLLNYYKKNYNPEEWRYSSCCFELLKPLREMGLEEEFVKVLRIPSEKLYPSESSDSDFSE